MSELLVVARQNTTTKCLMPLAVAAPKIGELHPKGTSPAESLPRSGQRPRTNACRKYLACRGFDFVQNEEPWRRRPDQQTKNGPKNPPKKLGRKLNSPAVFVIRAVLSSGKTKIPSFPSRAITPTRRKFRRSPAWVAWLPRRCGGRINPQNRHIFSQGSSSPATIPPMGTRILAFGPLLSATSCPAATDFSP